MGRRAHGTGSIWAEKRSGYEVWIGQVRVGGRQYQRTLGRKRAAGSNEGLTRVMAERALRDRRDEIEAAAERSLEVGERSTGTLAAVGERHCVHLETVLGRRPQTVQDYRIVLTRHLLPFFGDVLLSEIDTQRVEEFMHRQVEVTGLAHSTIANQVNLLHAIFKTAMRSGTVSANPVAAAQRPSGGVADADIRFLEVEDVEALLRSVTDDDLGETDAVLFLTAAMTGLRQGEIIALRWRDVDWASGVIRVRHSYTRGRLGRPKSRSSVRAVPIADRVATELERHFARSSFTEDEDLVFCHPRTGEYYVASTLLIRFKAALKRAGVRQVRFHDLRHTFATRMAAAGTPLRALQAYMGHADIQTTMIYADYAPDSTNGRAWAERAFAAPDSAHLTAVANG